MQRRAFVKTAVGGLAALVAARFLAACGSTEDDAASDGDCSTGGASATAFANDPNHGHSITIPKTDIDAGVDKTYPSIGFVGHDHTLTVTAADYAQLAAGNSVTISSSVTGHKHDITLRC
jgi:hypothetical protein